MRFLVTAGPTQEPIDPVRYISNRSSGRMGYAVAEAAIEAGHSVTLVSGRVNLAPPPLATVIPVTTSDEMHAAVIERVMNTDALVMCAAVADYRPAAVSKQKIKKKSERLSLELVPTRDILGSLPRDRKFLAVGFAAETNDVEKYARKKLQDKNLDLIVANDVSRADIGMESADNEVTILFRDGQIKKISRTSKKNIARELIKIISNMKKNV
ncbi:MAG TPA: bifunctional phosphopantothenoylcysteine decarboxylase/phosphopantothenate--cysteine ligase CoaBC [Chthoniobacterales bacterium]|nr:bifunctional phosphopantothenoylcysteine decarboxylase/phosphopantothenate--cysteine ligase CoaBC [Chthoniobacterales bacterium]